MKKEHVLMIYQKIASKFCMQYWANLRELTSIPSEIIRKPYSHATLLAKAGIPVGAT